uniref:RING-type domain-containing protein n=2 Tax=Phaeomonas parva TaxID=124430 RepID=A0A7S1XS47_9STRA|mmetsp:Transcript_28427/g.90978  ORF Transcript_28427/g.90978 Transcript_28427/m.90978 type:complete len:195 (+) Transcript_28427:356-940(+)
MAAFLLVMTMDHVLVDEERSPLREFVLRTGGEEQLILWHDKLARGKHLVDVLGLVWFIIGNLWVLSDDDSSPGQGKSALFILCVFFIVVYYIQICLPCAVAVAAIPVLCFCLPCLLRFMVRMQDAEAHAERRGAEEDVIDRIPIRKFASSQLSSDDDATCAICLCEYADEVRPPSDPCGVGPWHVSSEAHRRPS